jgi:hypothetical protein
MSSGPVNGGAIYTCEARYKACISDHAAEGEDAINTCNGQNGYCLANAYNNQVPCYWVAYLYEKLFANVCRLAHGSSYLAVAACRTQVAASAERYENYSCPLAQSNGDFDPIQALD